MLKEWTRSKFEREIKNGNVEVMYEPTPYGTAEVRSTTTNKRFTVVVREVSK